VRCTKELVSNIGQTTGRHPSRLFGIRQSDMLHHMTVFGQTGTGKSTLLARLMKQDREQGTGFCLIDPHGDLAKEVSSNMADEHIYWDVANPDGIFGYNPLTYVSASYRPLIASGLIDTLKRQWADAWGARMEHLLRYALLALLECPHSSLQDIIPMFLNKGFQAQVLAKVSDPQVRTFWETEYKAMNFKNAADGVAPIANKLGAFLAHPVIRKAVCAPKQPLRFRQLMDEGKILIVNLAKGKLGADVSNVMGGLIVSSLAHAAYSRESVPEAERRPYTLYCDEFHSFTTAAFADMLSDLRKFALSLVLTTQHTSKIEPSVFEAILGNVGTLISFRVGATDAAILARQFAADVPQPRDLINLPNYEMYIKLMVDGRQGRPFSAITLSLPLGEIKPARTDHSPAELSHGQETPRERQFEVGY
jgi:type IV secretory pathway TraG/TraD family ATPase VirD4